MVNHKPIHFKINVSDYWKIEDRLKRFIHKEYPNEKMYSITGDGHFSDLSAESKNVEECIRRSLEVLQIQFTEHDSQSVRSLF